MLPRHLSGTVVVVNFAKKKPFQSNPLTGTVKPFDLPFQSKGFTVPVKRGFLPFQSKSPLTYRSSQRAFDWNLRLKDVSPFYHHQMQKVERFVVFCQLQFPSVVPTNQTNPWRSGMCEVKSCVLGRLGLLVQYV